MTIDEAIRIMGKELSNHPYHKSTPFYRACNLGIEALEWIKILREEGVIGKCFHIHATKLISKSLPSETKK